MYLINTTLLRLAFVSDIYMLSRVIAIRVMDNRRPEEIIYTMII
jgi:hypothetical protein